MARRDYGGVKLGKKAARHDARTLHFADYLLPGRLPPPPPAVQWSRKVTGPWGMLKNDEASDCTLAGVGHAVLLWSSAAGAPKALTDAEVIAGYVAVTGGEGAAYDPATGDNDEGCVELDVLAAWRRDGFAGHRLGAYVGLEPRNVDHVKHAVEIFGLTYIGVALPESAKAQIDAGKVWAVPPAGPSGAGARGSWGGHCVIVTDYDRFGLTCVTWGELQRMTWQFWQTYCDEAYALIAPEWMRGDKSVSGFDMAALNQHLRQIAA